MTLSMAPYTMHSSVSRTLYKHLMRLANHYDRRPALKALTVNPIQISPGGEVQFHRINQSIERVYQKLPFYLEPRSWASVVRSEFRMHSSDQSINQSTKSLTDTELQLIHSDLFTLIRVLKSIDQDLNPNDRLLFDSSAVDTDPAIQAIYQTYNQTIKREDLADEWMLKPLLKLPVSSNLPIKRPRGRPPSNRSNNIQSNTVVTEQPAEQSSEQSTQVNPSATSSSKPVTTSSTNQSVNQSTNQSVKYFRTLDRELQSIEIKVGSMFVSHPAILTWPFNQSVFLITDHDEKSGTKAVIINKPINDPSIYNRTRTNEHEEQLWRLYQRYVAARHLINANQSCNQSINPLTDPVSLMRAQPPMINGGPVKPSLTLLHRLPAFADVSDCVIDGPYPVYKVDASKFAQFGEKLHEAVKLIEFNKNVAMNVSNPNNQSIDDSMFKTTYPNDMLLTLGHSSWVPNQLRLELMKGDWLPVQGNGNHVFAQSNVTMIDHMDHSIVPSINMSINRAIQPSQELNDAVSTLTQSSSLSPPFPMRALWRHAWWQMGSNNQSNNPSNNQSNNESIKPATHEFRHFAYTPATHETDDSFGHSRRNRARSSFSKTTRQESDNSGNIP